MFTVSRNFRLFLILVRKDLHHLSSRITSILLDCTPPLFTQVITFGYLFPAMGLPSDMIAPVYLGSMLALFWQVGFSSVMKVAFDLEYSRFIDYQITLPLPKRWLFASYIVNNMIEVGLVTIPLFSVGIFLLKAHFVLHVINWLVVALMYLLILAFYATFFLAIGYTLRLTWIMDNVWPRILAPLWWLSASLMVWKKVYTLSPLVGYIMLANPITYVAEGMRAAFLGNQNYIPWQASAAALVVGISINCVVLTYGITKKLDPI